ncbi:MAG: efflux RND transporter periplasmic adaptor subunit [Elusimicrobia bacterium]|nr:efflux RND transporter periplasmic adaptor subunit [Elusimicrobiota bacterium]
MRVKVVQLGADGHVHGLYYSGVVDAEKNISLSFLTPGTVSEVPVREGDRVRKGQLLAKLDCESNKNSFRIAQEKARQAEDAFNRFEPMYKNGNLPEIKMVEIRTGKVQAELAEKLARKNMEDCSLTAPDDGLISARSIEPGDNAAPGMPALKLVSVDKVYAVISVPESEISGIKKGVPVSVELSGQGNRRVEGKVADAGVSADPLSRTYTVRVLLKNPDSKILPGMLCNVYISRREGPAGVAVPASAIKMDGDNRHFVFVFDGPSRRVRKTEIVLGGFREGGVLVVSGLQGNESVVREGVQKLDDGMLVEAAL